MEEKIEWEYIEGLNLVRKMLSEETFLSDSNVPNLLD
jgi:hypothetical protein